MKRTNQMRKGNVTGAGHSFRGQQPVASVPRTEPYPRQIRAFIKMSRRNPQTMPKWAVTSSLLDWLFYRAGVYELDPPEVVA